MTSGSNFGSTLGRGNLGNCFGERFRVTSFGESHGPAIGCVIEGCPPGLTLKAEDIQEVLDRRKPGIIKGSERESLGVSARRESDEVQILSGVYQGKSLGTPIALITKNIDAKSEDYLCPNKQFQFIFRPSHADYSHWLRFKGHIDPRGGGRASARETWSRVAAGAVALKILKEHFCPELLITIEIEDKKNFEKRVKKALLNKDSIGGVLKGKISGLPGGLGDPVFNRVEAKLAQGLMSIPAARGFEMGSGFESCIKGSGKTQNDQMRVNNKTKKVEFLSNHSGGVLGGITRGDDILFRLAFKPTSTLIGQPQQTIGLTKEGELKTVNKYLIKQGRHDASVLTRAIPVVESMCALVLIDFFL